jgi:RNA-binding protein Nova
MLGCASKLWRSFVEESNASIKLSPLEQSLPGVNDRIVTITGTLDQQLRAAALIVTKLSQDPNYHQYSSTSLSYTGRDMILFHRLPFVLHHGQTLFMK